MLPIIRTTEVDDKKKQQRYGCCSLPNNVVENV